jgi:hypothetical protein
MSAVAGAQDAKMDQMKKMDGMPSEQSYTGCIERTPEGGFTLAHAMAPDHEMKKPTGMDAMAKDSMMKDSTPALALSSTSVDLGKHVGHKVTVKGANGHSMGDMTTFTVKSIKMVASSCS